MLVYFSRFEVQINDVNPEGSVAM